MQEITINKMATLERVLQHESDIRGADIDVSTISASAPGSPLKSPGVKLPDGYQMPKVTSFESQVNRKPAEQPEADANYRFLMEK